MAFWDRIRSQAKPSFLSQQGREAASPLVDGIRAVLLWFNRPAPNIMRNRRIQRVQVLQRRLTASTMVVVVVRNG